MYPESEIHANFFAATGEKGGELLAKHVADFRPLISRKSGRKTFHEKSSTLFTRDTKQNSLTARFWEWEGPGKKLACRGLRVVLDTLVGETQIL